MTRGRMQAEPADGDRVLVLGAGFIGAAIVHSLLERHFQVVVLTRSPPTRPLARALLSGAEVLIADASEMGALATVITDVEHVVYALGTSSPARSDLDPASDIGIVVPPLVRLLELLRLRPSVKVTYLSSGGTVYGDAGRTPVTESAATHPISSYGILKLTCEKYLEMYAEAHGLPVRILRIANVYGRGQEWVKGQGLVARLLESARSGEAIPLYGSGETVRDYVHIDDVADAVADTVNVVGGPRIVNLGTGVGHTVSEVADLVAVTTGQPVNVQHFGSRSFDVEYNVLDISRLQQLISFRPRNLESGVRATWQGLDRLDGRPVIEPHREGVFGPGPSAQ